MRRVIQQDERGKFYQLDEDLKGNAMAYLPGPITCVTTISIDMTEADSLRRELQEGQEVHVSITSLLIKAAAIALKDFTILGGKWESLDKIRLPEPEEIDICGPIQVEDTIGVFSINKANQKTLLQISQELEAQINEMRPLDEVKWPEEGLLGPSFWITNVGTIGPVEEAYGPVAWFATSILVVGAVLEKPAVKEGQIVARQMMNASLVWDHRAMMANTPIEFLTCLKRNLEEPATYLA